MAGEASYGFSIKSYAPPLLFFLLISAVLRAIVVAFQLPMIPRRQSRSVFAAVRSKVSTSNTSPELQVFSGHFVPL